MKALTFDPSTSRLVQELLAAPVSLSTPEAPDGFYAKGSTVYYRSVYRRRFEEGDAVQHAREEALLYTLPIRTNREDEILSAEQVARLVAALLNQHREQDLANRGIRRAV